MQKLRSAIIDKAILSGANIGKDQNQYTLEEIKNMCQRINPNSQLQLQYEPYGNFINWYDYFDLKFQNIDALIYDLFFFKDHLDSDFIELLIIIEDTYTQHILGVYKGRNLSNTNLSIFENSFYDLFKNTDKLFKKLRENFTHHQREYHALYRREKSQ